MHIQAHAGIRLICLLDITNHNTVQLYQWMTSRCTSHDRQKKIVVKNQSTHDPESQCCRIISQPSLRPLVPFTQLFCIKKTRI